MPVSVQKQALKRLFAQWMPFHCTNAKTKLRDMLGLHCLDSSKAAARGTAEITRRTSVRVETAAGIVVVANLDMNTKTTVRDVKVEIAKHSSQFPLVSQQLHIVGHENRGLLRDGCVLGELIGSVRSHDVQSVATQADKLTNGETQSKAQFSHEHPDQICLCVTLRTATWSRSCSHPGCEMHENDRNASRSSRGGGLQCAVGAILLTQPGHSFTIRVIEPPRTCSYLFVGVQSASRVLHKWRGNRRTQAVKPALCAAYKRNTVRMHVLDDPVGDPYGQGCVPAVETGTWKRNDQITVRLESGYNGELGLIFEHNATPFHALGIAKHNPEATLPFVPYCILGYRCSLGMVSCDGDAVETIETAHTGGGC